jgi:replication factor A1
MADQLTTGILERIYGADSPEDDVLKIQPIVQLISSKKMNSSGMDRWRAIISDGEHIMQSMFATQLNHVFENGTLNKYDIVRIGKFTCNNVQSKRCPLLYPISVPS